MARDVYYSNISKDKQIESISKELSRIFVKDSNNEITINFYALKKNVKEILDKVKLINKTYEFIDKKKKTRTSTIHYLLNFEKNAIKNRQLLIKGYVILMDFLEALTGQSIDYRCYYIDESNKSSNQVFVKTFNKEEILQKLIVGTAAEEEYRFVLDKDKLQEELKENGKKSELEQNFIVHFNNLYNDIMLNDMQPGYDNYGFMVHSIIIDTYGSSETKTPRNLFNKFGKYKRFNRGHIIEGLDISIFESKNAKTYEELLTLNYEDIKKLFFTKNLNYDNIKGLKQGDNTLTGTQIKMFNAGLMNYSTIYNYLERLFKVLNSKDKNFMLKELTDMFYEDVEKAVEGNIEKTVNNIVKDNKTKDFINLRVRNF